MVNVFVSSSSDGWPKFRKAVFIVAISCSHRAKFCFASAAVAAVVSPAIAESDHCDDILIQISKERYLQRDPNDDEVNMLQQNVNWCSFVADCLAQKK